MGRVLRKYLYEDVATLVEDFLFSRVVCVWVVGSVDPSLLWRRALHESDYDVVLYVYFLHLHPLQSSGSLYHEVSFCLARDVSIVKLLLALFGSRSPRNVASMFMYYAISGRMALLSFVCDTMVVPKSAVRYILCELRMALLHHPNYHPTQSLSSECVCWSPENDESDGFSASHVFQYEYPNYQYDCDRYGDDIKGFEISEQARECRAFVETYCTAKGITVREPCPECVANISEGRDCVRTPERYRCLVCLSQYWCF